MKLIRNHTKLIYLATLIGVSVLLFPSFAVASQTTIYQEIITSSNASTQNSSIRTSEAGSASVEIFSKTVIDGKQYDYYFSTSTPHAVDYNVTIENGMPTFADLNISNNFDNRSTSDKSYDQEYQIWLTSMIHIINYLQLYVANSL